MNTDVMVRLAGVVRESIVDGPGIRFTVFCQGCPHQCPGCHNPATWDFDSGFDTRISRILEEIDKNPLLGGVTLSGGEPFCQAVAMSELAAEVKSRGLHLVTYTGYTCEELLENASLGGNDAEAVKKLLFFTDWLIDGPFVLEKKDLQLHFRGSSNQRIINMQATLQKGEIVLDDACSDVI